LFAKLTHAYKERIEEKSSYSAQASKTKKESIQSSPTAAPIEWRAV
jgi:hypothetical protein